MNMEFESLDVSTGIIEVTEVDYTVDYGVLLKHIHNICDNATTNFIRFDFKDEDDVRLKYSTVTHKLDLRTMGRNVFDVSPFIGLFSEYPFIRLKLGPCCFDVGEGARIIPVLKQCEFWTNTNIRRPLKGYEVPVLTGMEMKGMVDIRFEYDYDYWNQIFDLQEYFRNHKHLFYQANVGHHRFIDEGKYVADFHIEKLESK